MTNGYDLNAVCATARRLARKNSKIYFVVYEQDPQGCYHVASEFDLDTWWQGITDANILYCTEN